MPAGSLEERWTATLKISRSASSRISSAGAAEETTFWRIRSVASRRRLSWAFSRIRRQCASMLADVEVSRAISPSAGKPPTRSRKPSVPR